jgi:thiosulfate dehydrogenase [quinone] large subunit
MNFSERTYLWYIALLRLYVGYYLLYQGIRKYQRGFPHGDWIGRQIGDLAKVDIYPWYRVFLNEFVVPHREIFGYLILSGEILVGAALLLGLMTRLSALVALFMLINYYLGPGMARGGPSLAQQQMFIITLVIIFLSNAGRTLGLDGFLFGRKGKGAK